jgi:hypothetical protein
MLSCALPGRATMATHSHRVKQPPLARAHRQRGEDARAPMGRSRPRRRRAPRSPSVAAATPRATDGRDRRAQVAGSYRTVPIFPAVEAELVRLLERELEVGRGRPDDLVFCTRNGRPTLSATSRSEASARRRTACSIRSPCGFFVLVPLVPTTCPRSLMSLAQLLPARPPRSRIFPFSHRKQWPIACRPSCSPSYHSSQRPGRAR